MQRIKYKNYSDGMTKLWRENDIKSIVEASVTFLLPELSGGTICKHPSPKINARQK